jgi:hypothetical protein
MKPLLFIAAALLCGLAHAASVKDILADPRAYVEQSVTIRGQVTGVLSLFVFKYFTVSDGTGAINVITDRPLPRKGLTVTVTGRVVEVFSFGPQTLLVLVEDEAEAVSAERASHRVALAGVEETPGLHQAAKRAIVTTRNVTLCAARADAFIARSACPS